MRSFKVTSLVLLLHISLVALICFQSGCQNCQSRCSSPAAPCRVASNCDKPCNDSDILPSKSEMCFFDDSDTPITQTVPERSIPERPGPNPPVCMSCRSLPAVTVSKPERFTPQRPTCNASNAVPPQAAPPPPQIPTSYYVKQGDSLWTIAKKYNISVADIASVNGIQANAFLKIGQKLTIPSPSPSASTTKADHASASFSYKIVTGDTLSGIAKRFHVSTQAIKEANHLTSDIIVAGKTLVIPRKSDMPLNANSSSEPTSISSTQSSQPKGTYQIKSGETLSIIAKRYNTSVTNLMQWNNIKDARKIRAGQYIQISPDNLFSSSQIENSNPSFNEFAETSSPSSVNSGNKAADSFNLFDGDDESLFDTTGEIPVVSLYQ